MTVKEAQQRLDECEAQVRRSYQELKDNVQRVGVNTTQAASLEKKKKTLLPLLLCVLGLLLLTGPWYLGLPLIAAGGYISYRMYGPARKLQEDLEELQRELNDEIVDINDSNTEDL